MPRAYSSQRREYRRSQAGQERNRSGAPRNSPTPKGEGKGKDTNHGNMDDFGWHRDRRGPPGGGGWGAGPSGGGINV